MDVKKASFSHFFPGFERVLEASTPPLQQRALANAQAQAQAQAATTGPRSTGAANPNNMTSTRHAKIRSLDGLFITTITDTKIERVSVQLAVDSTTEANFEFIGNPVSSDHSIDMEVDDTTVIDNPRTETNTDDPLPTNCLHNDDGVPSEFKRARGKIKYTEVEDERDRIGIFNDQGVDVTKIPRPMYLSKPHSKARKWITSTRCEDHVEKEKPTSSRTVTKRALSKTEDGLVGSPNDTEARRRPSTSASAMMKDVAPGRSTSVQCRSRSSNQHDPGAREEPDQEEFYGPQEQFETYFNHICGPDVSYVGKDGDVYTNLWHKTDEGGRIMHTFVNDQDVSFRFTTQDLFSDNTQKQAPLTNFEKLEDTLWKAGAAVDQEIHRLERSWKMFVNQDMFKAKTPPALETEFEVDMFYYRNPPDKTRQHDNTPPGLLSSLAKAMYRAITRHPKNEKGKQGIVLPDLAGYLGESKKKQIGKWISKDASIEWEEADFFVACNTAELKKLNGETLDRMRVIKTYIGPPATPVNGPICSVGVVEDEQGIQLEIYEPDSTALPPFVSSKEFDHHAIHKDLCRLMGTRRFGPHVFGSHLPQCLEQAQNMSEYYGMPILESCERLKFNHIYASDRQDGDDDQSNMSAYPTHNCFHPAYTLPPAQSLVLFLSGKGMAWNIIGAVLATLDEKFVYQWPSRWWNGFRIPDHWQFTDDIVEEIKNRCGVETQWWEEEFNCYEGIISDTLRNLTCGKNIRAGGQFAKKVLENHFRSRCKNGKRFHKEILSI